MVRPSAAAFAVILLAGCAAPVPRPSVSDLGDGVGVDAPDWRVGDWWTYHLTSDVYAKDLEVTLVVGRAGPTGYAVGMPAEDYATDAILFHMPPTGTISRALSYDVHDVPFEPLRFPLADGDAWETAWAATAIELAAHGADVRTPSGTERGFVVSNEAAKDKHGRDFRLEYAPSVGWFASYERAFLDGRALERLELVKHGRGFTGEVRLLEGIDVVLLEARSGVVLRAGVPASPVLDFTPDAALDTLLVACVYGGGPGTYRAEVRSPTGEVCATEGTVAADDLVVRTVAREVANEPGAWRATLASAGSGNAVAEVLGYRASSQTLSAS
ncbi:MAG TPA: hypothetical protein VI997_05205 [Candidatus Thermoplasmatota archaeon]|nr:hypothetical protein [Candidatus Thermoplasmatota archaeon]